MDRGWEGTEEGERKLQLLVNISETVNYEDLLLICEVPPRCDFIT